MRVVGSNRFYLNPSEKETLDRMARDRHCGGLAMHGGASDGDSSDLEEISAEDFSKQSRGGRHGMRKGYLMSKNYAPNLYSFAWAQTVENKPLGFDTMPMIAGDLVANDASAVKNEKEEACDVNIMGSRHDSDREIEKEEGEIELTSVLVAEETTGHSCAKPKKESDVEGLPSVEDFDMRVGLILEALDAITVEEALTSFDGACSRLRKLFEDLKPMFTGIKSSDRVLYALVQRAFMGIQTIYSALDSVKMQRREQNIQMLLRLLIHIKNQYSLLLMPELLKELDTVVSSLAIEGRIKEKGQLGGIGNNINNLTVLSKDPGILSNGSIYLEKPYLDQKEVELHKLELPIPTASRNIVEFGPLLDLHADYVVDSLPSLRRENLPRQPSFTKAVGLGMVPPASSQTTAKIEDAEYVLSHPYVTDALKAVSSYHLKFGSSSFQSSNRLQSPTPSKERVKDDDSHDEVSISSIAANVTTAKRAAQIPIVISNSDGQLYSVELVSSGSKPALKPALECRDPRFKFMNSTVRGPAEGNGGAPDNGLVHGTSNSRKHKTVDEPVAGQHRMKRQRNEFPSTRDMKITSDGRECLEDNVITSESNNRSQACENFPVGIRKPANSTVDSGKNLASKSNFLELNGLNSNPSSNPASDVSLPSLLKAVNPAILTQLLQMQQKRIAANNLQRATASTSVVGIVSNDNGFPGLVSSISSTSFISKDDGGYQQIISQIPPLLASANSQTDIGRIHMKPCDPRHVLHNNMFEKNEAIFSEENKIRAIFGSQSSMGCLSAREPGEQAESSVSSKLFCIPTPPNVSQQLSKNLVNILSNYQKIITAPVFSHSNSVPIINKADQVDAKPTSAELLDSNTTSVEVSEASVGGASQSANSWRDLDHLLAGFNDEQKASIQRERARRIAEQNIMFAARKLCLVLDLDHTLLNSAKFIEVDPFHEEMLRRKEEQDREIPQRHLFRLQHMGMWTKLRPGIWNFLEKASKLYELHLYTMGNKHYATEMAKVLDPTGTLFSGRVMSRGDDDPFDGDERVPKIKDLDGVLGMESAVVIIDDTRRVWPHNKHNLIVVERYTYFPSSRRQFGLLGPSLLEIQHDERLEDGTLASALAVIERLHQIFFSHHSLKDVDVRNILAAEQRKILAGCRIVFSRIFPVGEANPRLHPLWQTAEQFGAVCTNLIDEEVTHVVANSLGTDKVNWALSTGRFVVHPGWVEASALLYRRANEHDYAVRTMA